jgi:hypothetical protein
MKIAVYSIALNEAQFAERWADSAADANYRVVADTGSTDDTVARLRAKGVEVHSISIKPWRFDRAREANLALVPADADVCICLDLDEVLQPGWRAALEAAWAPGTTRLRYPFVWNWTKDGKPLNTLYGHRIHARHAYHWRYPIHEVLMPLTGVIEKVVWTDDLHIHHRADDAKPRAQYLPMLELAVREDPQDARLAHYYGRELMFHRKWSEAIAELERHIRLPDAAWATERSASMRYLARCYAALERFAEAEAWLLRACAETPDVREPWIELARHFMHRRDWQGGVWAARRALSITTAPKGVMYDTRAWALAPHDIGSVCAYYAGLMDLSREWLSKALELAPEDPRIQGNRKFIFPEETARKTGE